MIAWGLLLICAAYLLGLASTGLRLDAGNATLPLASYGVLLLGLLGGIVMPQLWRLGPTRKQWFLAGMIGFIGAIYCVWRIPQPAADDISHFIPAHGNSFHSVLGTVVDIPQTTRSGKGKFWLQVRAVQDQAGQSVGAVGASRQDAGGKLYVTAPLGQVAGLYPGQWVQVSGKLYEPSPAEAPGEFDFRDYLARQGCFAGLSAKLVEAIPSQPSWGLWHLRQRIVTAQARWLGTPAGPLVSAMTLGQRAVDIPYEVRDAFIQAGLAHTLAASGFQVSLIVGIILVVMRSHLPVIQAMGGSLALLIYVGLTGLQPSILRAAVMGFGALIGLALQRQVKPLGCLLLAVTLLLLWNPRWVWDIGFQLSVIATLGLIVTAPRLVKAMDRLPVAISTLIAVPLAAYLWTVPLQLHYFGTLPSYSIGLNLIATPLITLLSLGGFISAMAAMMWPLIGSALAWPLAIPIQLLIGLVTLFNQLPGNQLQVGNIAAWQVIASYSIYAAVSLWLERRRT